MGGAPRAWNAAPGSGVHHIVLGRDGRIECAARLEESVSFEILSAPPGSKGFGPAAHLRRRAALRAAAPDLVATYNWGAIEWAASARLFPGRPHVHFEDGFGPEEADRLHARRNIIRRIVLRDAALVVPSVTLRQIAGLEWNLSDATVLHGPNGIDLARFDQAARAAPPAAARPGEPEEVLVGVAAPLRRDKNAAPPTRAAPTPPPRRAPRALTPRVRPPRAAPPA